MAQRLAAMRFMTDDFCLLCSARHKSLCCTFVVLFAVLLANPAPGGLHSFLRKFCATSEREMLTRVFSVLFSGSIRTDSDGFLCVCAPRSSRHTGRLNDL